MKEFFRKDGHLLSEAEKEEIWRQISFQQVRIPRARWTLRPLLATTAVSLAGLMFAVFLFHRQPGPLKQQGRLGKPHVTQQLSVLEEPGVDRKPAAVPLANLPAQQELPDAHEPGSPPGQQEAVVSATAKKEAPAAVRRPEPATPAEPGDHRVTVPPEPASRGRRGHEASKGLQESTAQKGEQAPQGRLNPEAPGGQEGGPGMAEGTTPTMLRGGRAESTRVELDANSVARALAAGDTSLIGPARGIGQSAKLALAGRVVALGDNESWPPSPPRQEPHAGSGFESEPIPLLVRQADSLATFSVYPSDVSYWAARRNLNQGVLPPPETIRAAEFVNNFSQGYAAPRQGDFAIQVDGMPSPFAGGGYLLRVGIQGRTVPPASRKPANLLFVIDVSGSLADSDRLALTQRAVGKLLAELSPDDHVGIVTFDAQARMVLGPTPSGRRQRITEAFASLRAGGSGGDPAGMGQGCELALAQCDPRALNSVVVCGGGEAVGQPVPAADVVANLRRSPLRDSPLLVLGLELAGSDRGLQTRLENLGLGGAACVDDAEEAARVFRRYLNGHAPAIATDAQVEVSFRPERVQSYRLVGYQRERPERGHQADTGLTAGTVRADFQLALLFEVALTDTARRSMTAPAARITGESPLGVVTFRWHVAGSAPGLVGPRRQLERPILGSDLQPDPAAVAPRLRLMAAAAEFAAALQHGGTVTDDPWRKLVPMTDQLVQELPGDPSVRELQELVRRAADLPR